MAYIGNTNTTQAFTPAVDYFSGSGSTTSYTLSRPVASVAQIQVVIENVPQNPSSAYTVSGNTITFTSAPPSGTNNIYVEYTSPITDVIQPGQGTVGQRQLDVAGGTGTGAMYIPSGTTAQRPSSPVSGYTRYNTTIRILEYWNGSAWTYSSSAPTYSASYLVVAGGGAGGTGAGAGGGAGGLLSGTITFSSGTTYTATVGAGAAAQTSNTVPGANGSNSVLSGGLISTQTAIGGGGGTGQSASVGGQNGGSGGGSSRINIGIGSGTSGQGNNGGVGSGSASAYGGGGGGGASAVGGNGSSTNGGAGGAGTASSITGSSVTYAGGGGGSSQAGAGTFGAGGAGGGGDGALGTGTGNAGTVNTGGGGGGAGSAASVFASGAGGSGVVILSVPTSFYTGITTGSPTVTTSGSNTIIKFTASGSYTA